MSFQIHCDNCDESVGHFGDALSTRSSESGVVQIQVGGPDPMFREHRFSDNYFCDWLCLANWAKRRASDE